MRTTIDAGGRIVVPKKYRDLLGLVAGSEVEIELDGASTLTVEPVERQTELVRERGVLVAKAQPGAPKLTGEQIRAVLEATRDRR